MNFQQLTEMSLTKNEKSKVKDPLFQKLLGILCKSASIIIVKSTCGIHDEHSNSY